MKAKIHLTENCYGKKMVIIELMQVAKKFFSIEKSYRMIVCKCNIVVVFLNRLCLVVVEIFYNTSPGLISFYTISTEGTAVLN